jgi:Fe2+ or Zn2+ uptake regulation protein
MSKYKEKVLRILSKEEIKSTNQVLSELEKETKKTINWHALYRILMELELKGEVERLKAKAGFFWRKRENKHDCIKIS